MIEVKEKQVDMETEQRIVPVTIGEYTDLIGDSLIVDQVMSVFEDKSLEYDCDRVSAIRSILQIGAKPHEKSQETY